MTDDNRAATSTRRSRPLWRRILPFALLVGVSLWATLEWHSQNRAFAWTERLGIRVVPIVAPEVEPGEADEVIGKFLSLDPDEAGGLGDIARWFESEFRRFTGKEGPALELDLHAITRGGRPAPSYRTTRPDGLFLLLEQRKLMRHFRRVTSTDSTDADVVIYVYFYAPEDRKRYSGRSMACRRAREGFVFVPVDAATLGYYQALLAHELCHTFGAEDKYRDHASSYPHGYAEPVRVPLHPQTHAEIMALGIPRGKGKEAYVEGVRDCVIGDWTAREMGWTAAPPAETSRALRGRTSRHGMTNDERMTKE